MRSDKLTVKSQEAIARAQSIARTADELADLLEHRTHLHNHSEFSSETYYHPIDLVEAAAKGNGLYASFLKDKLDALRYQFDLKYWPSLSTMTGAMAVDARHWAPFLPWQSPLR